MLHKFLVLLAAVGLFATVSAASRADSMMRAIGPAGHHLSLDSIRMLHAMARGAAFPSGIDINRAIQRASRGGKGGTPPRFGNAGPFGDEFEPAPDFQSDNMEDVAVAFGDTEYLVVWVNYDDWNIYGARVGVGGKILDPTGFQISFSGTVEFVTSVASDGTDFLVVWDDWRNGPDDIYGTLVNQSGSVLSPSGILITPNTDGTYQLFPSVAFDGDNYLVVWQDDRNGKSYDIYAARVSTAGVVRDQNGIPISTAAGNQYDPSVAFDGNNYLVVWEDGRNVDLDIYGARVTPSGFVLNDTGIEISAATNDQQFPKLDFDGTNYLIVWQDDRNSSTDIYGARVSQSGSVLDDTGILISKSAPAYPGISPSVAFDGTDYAVAWTDEGSEDVYGCQVSLAGSVGESYAISSMLSYYPALACGPVHGTAMVAYNSLSVEEDTSRIWARQATFDTTGGNVGTVSIVRPVASYLLPSWEIPPVAQLKNFGPTPRTFRAQFTISKGGEDAYSSTKTVLGLDAGQTRSVRFDSFPLVDTGLYTCKCTTMLAGDGIPSNDSATAIFQGCTFINFTDLTNGGCTPSGNGHWHRGKPTSPPWSYPPMDTAVWGDTLTGNYGNGENAFLTSPIYEALQDNPAIAFQHNVSTESLHDGGNLWYSTSGWADSVAPTFSGGFAYNGNVNALNGDGWSGWGNSQSGWRQSVFTIPVDKGQDFQVRWHFASDSDSTSYGWLIDEVAGINCDLASMKGKNPGRHGSVIDTMLVSPNPVSHSGQVSYTLLKDCDVSIKLYDATGALAERLATAGSGQGAHTATLDASKLHRGVYFLKIQGEGDTQTTKVIIE